MKEALKALKRARNLAMEQTLAARIPECGKFGEIAQDLDYACNELIPNIEILVEALIKIASCGVDKEWCEAVAMDALDATHPNTKQTQW